MKLPPHETESLPGACRVVFFSDAHLETFELGERERGKTRKVVEFLDWLRENADVVVVLGDLFDFYFEYGTVMPARYLRVLARLQALSENGVRCYYAAGNHDFWLGALFEEILEVRVVRDSVIFERDCGGVGRLLAAHGDGLGRGDTGYKVLKWFLRNPLLIRLFRLIHPDLGYAVARLTSRTSRRLTAGRQRERSEAMARTAAGLLQADESLEAVLLAHTHTPDRRELPGGLYLNTGDWCDNFSYVVWDRDGALELKYFDDRSSAG